MLRRLVFCSSLALAAGLVLLPAPASAQDDRRPAEAILKDIDAVETPRPDMAKLQTNNQSERQAYIQAIMKDMAAAREKRGKLALELFQADPKNDRVPELMAERWNALGTSADPDAIAREIDDAIAKTGDASLKVAGAATKARLVVMKPGVSADDAVAAIAKLAAVAPKGDMNLRSLLALASRSVGDEAFLKAIDAYTEKTGDTSLKLEGAFTRAMAAARNTATAPRDALAAIDAFAALAPSSDTRAGSLLMGLADRVEDKAEKIAIEDRVIKEYPDLAPRIEGLRQRHDGVGKPFVLAFTDAISGRAIDVQKDLKGKVVVVDFWATWCGPCVAEMPTMKKLYAEYKDKGVEFVGVSLDQPEESGKGLTKLKEFVGSNDIGWPQYYQGNYWNGASSRSGGINSIPCVFIVDKAGNLHSTEARGKLEELIPELLK